VVFNATFNNISVISRRSVLLVEETGENHRHVASHWQTLLYNVVSSTPRHWNYDNNQMLLVSLDCPLLFSLWVFSNVYLISLYSLIRNSIIVISMAGCTRYNAVIWTLRYTQPKTQYAFSSPVIRWGLEMWCLTPLLTKPNIHPRTKWGKTLPK
jgi:hypothetical protein